MHNEIPFKVLAIDQKGFLGYRKHQPDGAVVRKLVGPRSDSSSFEQSIINISSLRSAKIQIILLDQRNIEQ